MATVVKKVLQYRGIDGYTVDIEIKTLEGQPLINIIGLGDLAVKRSSREGTGSN